MYFLRRSFVFIVLQYVLVSVAGLQTYYFTDLCPSGGKYNTKISLRSTAGDYGSTAILKAKRYSTYPLGLTCNVVVQSPYGVVVAIRSTDLRARLDNLTITDNYGLRTTFYGYNYYSDEYRSLYSSGDLTITFMTGSSSVPSTLLNDGFQLTVTAYRSFPCYSYEFDCSNLRCIAKELTCDHHNHCGDRSDQLRCGMSVGSIVGVSLGSVFLIIAIIAGAVYFRNRRNRIITTTIHRPPPQPVQPPYAPYGATSASSGSFPPPPQYSTTQHQEAVNPMYK